MQWDDPSAYEYTKSLSLREWGWEFIRRDERYKAEWQEHYKKFEKAGGQKNLMFLLMNGDELSQFSSQSILSLNDYMNLGNPKEIGTFIILSEDALKWGLRGYKNPEGKKLHNNQTLIIPAFRADETTARTKLNAKSDTLIASLDLTKPLTKQLAIIKEQALQLQQSLRREQQKTVSIRGERLTTLNKKLWQQYLRLLDSIQSGIKRGKAAKQLYAGSAQAPEEKYSEHLKQIKALKKSYYTAFMH